MALENFELIIPTICDVKLHKQLLIRFFFLQREGYVINPLTSTNVKI